jgi:hypothetical protein
VRKNCRVWKKIKKKRVETLDKKTKQKMDNKWTINIKNK